MAYLRGNSYVDGDLIVEGALKVSAISFIKTEGNFPYLGENSLEHRLIMFKDGAGGLVNSTIEIANSAVAVLKAMPINNSFAYLRIGHDSSKVEIINHSIKLKEATRTWEYV